MPRLSIYLLGTFQALLDGELLKGFQSVKVRALLAYLVMESHTPHTREELATLFWPELPHSQARHNLRQALFNLRSLLGEVNGEVGFLHITRTTVQFNAESDYWLDVEAFLEHLAACNPKSQIEECVPHLEQAQALYRGDFLKDVLLAECSEFEEWMRFHRERLHQQALKLLYRLAEYYEAHGDYEVAIEYARRQVALEPWREEAHRQLMRNLALSGRRNAALVQFQECKRILQQELGIEPSTETVLLFQSIRDGSLAPPQGEEITSRGPQPRRHNLPAPLTPFVGREQELAYIHQCLEEGRCRLVSILGPGGIGKSRLALEVARRHVDHFQDGVFFVSLSTVEDPRYLSQAIASVLHLPQKGQDLEEHVLDFLADKHMLLVLDNFEHLTDGATFLVRLLERAPNVYIIVTSREALDLRGEWQLSLKGLSYPEEGEPVTPETFMRFSALHLFVQSARRVRPDFSVTEDVLPWIVRICRFVEGSPLAIELATSWLRVLSCQDIAQGIERDLGLLSTTMRDVPRRHRSLYAVFEHSWNLLSPESQRAFRRLSVFRRSFTVRAAMEVAGVSISQLAALVNKSLIAPESQGRYSQHQLLHHFAAQRLADDPQEEAEMRARHARYFINYLAEQRKHVLGPRQAEVLDAIEEDMDNVRAAWQWMLEQRRFQELAPALDTLFHLYEIRGWFEEGARVFMEAERALLQGRSVDALTRAEKYILGRILVLEGWFLHRLSLYGEDWTLLSQGVQLLRTVGATEALAFALNLLGRLSEEEGNYAQATSVLEESYRLYEQAGDKYGMAEALVNLGDVADTLGNYERARAYYEQSMALFREVGTPAGLARVLNNLGNIAYREGRYDDARTFYLGSQRLRESVGDRLGLAIVLNNLGSVAQRHGDYALAHQYYEESSRLYREVGNRWSWAYALVNLGEVAQAQGDHMRALDYYRQALNTCRTLGHTWGISYCLGHLARAYIHLGRLEDARVALAEALDLAEECNSLLLIVRVLTDVGLYFLHAGRAYEGLVVLYFTLAHPATEQEERERVQPLLDAPPTPLPEDVQRAAQEAASHATVHSIVQQAARWLAQGDHAEEEA